MKCWRMRRYCRAIGIGTNLYLAKIALDITAKHAKDRIGILDEEAYSRILWDHRPLTDFWRVGPGTAHRLETMGIFTMREIAQAEEGELYRQFGVDAELLIDHAWGRETATMADIKAYRPKSNSIGSGQVIGCDCDYEGGRLIVKEMTDLLCQLTFPRVMDEAYQQYDLFTETAELEREHRIQQAVLGIREKYGKNAVLKGMNLQEGATTMERNCQIGGHRSGV